MFIDVVGHNNNFLILSDNDTFIFLFNNDTVCNLLPKPATTFYLEETVFYIINK